MRATFVLSLVLIGAACSSTAGHERSVESSTASPKLATSVVADTAAADRSAIVAVAAAERVRSGNAGVIKSRINVVERFGHFTPDGFVAPDSGGGLIDDQTRVAVEHALSPGVVTWVDSVDSVTNRGALTVDEVGLVLTITPPTITAATAEVGIDLWCGNVCGTGGTYLFERTVDNGWRVTGVRNEFVS